MIYSDLLRQFGSKYRILRADSGATALEVLRKLKVQGEAVALLLSDQRMPHMTGVEFLEAARQIYPDARAALITAYADTDVAIRAINQVKLDYYFTKPCPSRRNISIRHWRTCWKIGVTPSSRRLRGSD